MAPRRLLFVFLAVSFLEYLPSFDNPFRADDFVHLGVAEERGFSTASLTPSSRLAFYRPGALALFCAEHELFHRRSGLYIIFNYLLHVAAALIFWRVALLLSSRPTVAASAAGVFLVGFGHYGKQVMWACTSGALAAAVLVQLSLFLSLGIAHRQKTRAGLAAILAVNLLAPAFHDAGLIAGFISAIVLVTYTRRRAFAAVVFFAPVVVWAVARVAYARSVGYAGLPPAAHALGNAVRYMGFMLFPVQQGPSGVSLPPIYASLSRHASQVQVVTGALVVAFLAWRLRFGTRDERVIVAWFLAALVPFCFVSMEPGWVELRYVYLAAPPLALVLVRAWRFRSRWIAAVAMVLVVAYSVLVQETLERKYNRPVTPDRRAGGSECV